MEHNGYARTYTIRLALDPPMTQSIRAEVTTPRSARSVDVASLILRQIAEEREQWPLWLPVGFGTGIAAYFFMRSEPNGWLGAVILFASLMLIILARRVGRLQTPILALAVCTATVGAGFAAVQLRATLVAAPVLGAGTELR